MPILPSQADEKQGSSHSNGGNDDTSGGSTDISPTAQPNTKAPGASNEADTSPVSSRPDAPASNDASGATASGQETRNNNGSSPPTSPAKPFTLSSSSLPSPLPTENHPRAPQPEPVPSMPSQAGRAKPKPDIPEWLKAKGPSSDSTSVHESNNDPPPSPTNPPSSPRQLEWTDDDETASRVGRLGNYTVNLDDRAPAEAPSSTSRHGVRQQDRGRGNSRTPFVPRPRREEAIFNIPKQHNCGGAQQRRSESGNSRGSPASLNDRNGAASTRPNFDNNPLMAGIEKQNIRWKEDMRAVGGKEADWPQYRAFRAAKEKEVEEAQKEGRPIKMLMEYPARWQC
ncbi:MAG: hypothetical protein Q9218_001077 [Villophora microphyllina]